MGWEVGGRFRREGIDVYLWSIHVDVWQKSRQYCKLIILQLKKKKESACQSIGHEFDPWFRKIPHAIEQLSLNVTTIETCAPQEEKTSQ